MTAADAPLAAPPRHLLAIQGMAAPEIIRVVDLAETYVAQNRSPDKKSELLRGRTLVNLFYENSTRTRTSFELAGKRLGCDVINMEVAASSVKKGETLIDTAMTLNAMRPDIIVVRHRHKESFFCGLPWTVRSSNSSCFLPLPVFFLLMWRSFGKGLLPRTATLGTACATLCSFVANMPPALDNVTTNTAMRSRKHAADLGLFWHASRAPTILTWLAG